jgi:YmgG-like glycine-zipper protein
MIQSMRKASLIPVVILLITGLTAHAQQRAPRASDRQVGPILQRIETSTQAFRNSPSATLDQNRQQPARYYNVSWRPGEGANPQRNGRGGYAANRLTGTYRLDQARSDNPATVADRVTRGLSGGEQQRRRNVILRRLEAPESLAIERRGRTVTIASSRAPQITFEADGREQTEQTRNGRSMRTRTTLSGDQLTISYAGDRSSDFQVTFLPINNGQGLRVTRRITDERLAQPVVVNSIYEKRSNKAQLDLYTGAEDNPTRPGAPRGDFTVPDGTQLVAALGENLSTKQAQEGERFTLNVRSPSRYEGAIIEGHVARVNRSGRISGRAEMSFEFDRIRLQDGRTSNFAGYIDSVRTTSGETIQVDNEGRVQDDDSQTSRTVTRTGIGAAVGAVIGAIVGGGKSAAIGAAVGAGTGAGSVFVQGREDLDLMSGTEFMIRASAPR